MSKSKISIIGIILSLFFSGIILVALFVLWDLYDQPYYALKTIFVGINLAIIVIFAGFSKFLCKAITTPMFAAISVTSGLYTVIQFIALGINYANDSAKGFVLFQLILLFAYLLIVLPIGKMGYALAHKENEK